MLEALPASAGISALLAAGTTPASDPSSLGQFLPYVIGGVFTLGVILVGLVMSRKSSADAPPIPDGSAEQPPIYAAPNPLWKLVIPGVAVVGLGAAIVFFVVPFFQEMSDARDNVQSTMKANYETAVKSAITSSSGVPQMGPAVEIKPIQLPPQPQITVPHWTPPPPPHIPQPYVDSKGIIRTR